MSPKYKLTYFDIRGLGEPVRYMLSYMGKEFEDNRLQRSEWGPELKKSTIFGKLPTLEIDGKVYSDSRAICRYLAEEAGLAGKTPLENLVIDQTLGAFLDFHGELIRMMKTENPESKEKLKETLLNETCPFYFGKFDKILEENGGYLANGKLTWIDIYIVALTELAPALLGIDLADKYNNFKVLKEKVQSLPGIKEWIKKRPAATM